MACSLSEVDAASLFGLSLLPLRSFDGNNLVPISRYTLRVSVRVLGKAPITGLESNPAIEVGTTTVTVRQQWPYFILTANHFETEEDAEAFLPKIKIALWNLALEWNIAFKPYFERREITYASDPYDAARNLAKSFGRPVEEPLTPVHGLVEEEGYTIFESHKNIRVMSLNAPSVHVSTSWEMARIALLDGFQCETPADCSFDAALITAIDLYLSHFYEASIRARFLTMITCLEILAPITYRHASVVRAIDEIRSKIRKLQEEAICSEEAAGFKALFEQIGYKREIAIVRRVEALIYNEAPLNKHEREQLAEQLVEAYEVRSKMVHGRGEIEEDSIHEAFNTAFKAVKLVLRARLGLERQPAD